MRRGFTLIELMVVISIIAIVCAIAIPNLLESQKKERAKEIWQGETAKLKATGQTVMVVDRDTGGTSTARAYRCRIDNGEKAVPRFSEVTFMANEVEKIIPVEAPAPPNVEK